MSDIQEQHMQKIASAKGMNGLLLADAPLWEHFDSVVRSMLRAHGYQQIRTPIAEQAQLFVRDIGEVTDIIEEEMYTFTDALDSEQLIMRPEDTATVVRAVVEHNLLYGSPKRLWYTGPMFHHGRPQCSRYCQFHQVGVEAPGFADPDTDAEVILTYQRLRDNLGLVGLKLELNSLGQAEERAAYRADLIKYLEGFQDTLDEDSKRRLYSNPLRVLDTKNPALQDMAAGISRPIDYLDDESRAHFEGVQKLLKVSSIPFTTDPCLVRGLDYHNLTIFEWATDRLGAQGTVADGGRYDPLIEQIGGKPAPACGWAIGIKRIIELLRGEKLEPEAQGCDVYIVHQEDEAQVQALIAVERLRDADLDVILHAPLKGRSGSLRSQFKRAGTSGTSYAAVIGDDEVARGIAQVKPLRSDPTADVQQIVPSDQLIDRLTDALMANND